jgi:trehalose/maltose transport system substrate-binding protein
LEWQAAEGGGQVIEKDKTISVNNPDAIRAWQRAARWIGSISPPSVVGYKEWDSLNVWLAGDAAFMRNWTLGLSYAETQEAGSPIRNKFDVSLLPAGKAGRVSTFGGTGLAISRFSTHPRESVQLVRYLVSRDVQIRRSRLLSEAPVRPELYELREVLEPNPRFAILNQVFRTGIVSRPSNITGKNYEEVSSAYMQAIHSVLTGERSAPESAKALENELVRITGFKQGPPAGGSGRP